jgi:predicted NAD-dependent protein-ADP-ribosyltransferase YbiA (DUF1768 family)
MCNGRAVTPGTDNFEIAPFVYEGMTYYSAEQFYQALKMRKAADRAKIARCVPKPGEKAWDHGMRAWQAGQLGAARKDWEAVKVEAMYFANRVKLQQNPTLLASLLQSNGAPQGNITHMGSGKFWDQWNPTLLMLLREELSPTGGDAGRIAALHAEMDTYRASKHGDSLLAKLMPSSGSCVAEASVLENESIAVDLSAASAEEVAFEGNVLDLFRQFDADGSGAIDRDQFLLALQKIDASWTGERLEQVLLSADIHLGAPIQYEALVSRIFLDACERLSK